LVDGRDVLIAKFRDRGELVHSPPVARVRAIPDGDPRQGNGDRRSVDVVHPAPRSPPPDAYLSALGYDQPDGRLPVFVDRQRNALLQQWRT
jgi:hypothetical protein